jgi:ribosomal protein L37AE/L43A
MAGLATNAARRGAPAPATHACAVCGSHEIALDEVIERGLWHLAECRRCANQWTEGQFSGPRGPVARVARATHSSRAEAA